VSVRSKVLQAGAEAGYPVDTEALVARLGDDDEALLVMQAMADHRFVNEAELQARLDDALGMPSADPATSALDATTDWSAADEG
jgi:hypothetical protein